MNTPRELDAIVDRVFAYKPSPKAYKDKLVQSWSVSVEKIFADLRLRLDAPYYDPSVDRVAETLKDSGLELCRLDDLATVALPGKFARIWAKDADHGIRYVNATDLLSLLSLGIPSQRTRYLSTQSDTDIPSLIIRENWLLMTCSGTIGRVFHVPKRMDGWAATHDLIRIVSKSDLTGYLFAWFYSPAAQTQILSHTHGGQIDHITDAQVSSMCVPLLPDKAVKAINGTVIKALQSREKALMKLANSWKQIV